MRRHKKTLYLLSTSAFFALIAFSVYGVLVYAIDAQHKSSLALLEDAVKDSAVNEKVLSERALLRDVEEDHRRVARAFLGRDDIVALLSQIEGLAQKTGASVEVTSVSDVPADEKNTEAFPYGSIRLSVSADGSWSSVFQTLALLEHTPYAFWFDQVTLEGGEAPQSVFGEAPRGPITEWRLRAVLHVAKKKQYDL